MLQVTELPLSLIVDLLQKALLLLPDFQGSGLKDMTIFLGL